MGFFDKVFGNDDENEKKSKTEKKYNFTPIVVTTENVAQTLHDTALQYDISSQMLDIRILSVKTFVKTDAKEQEWIDLKEGEWEKFNKPEVLLTQDFSVKQEYEIEIFLYKKESWNKDLALQIAANKEKNRVVCTIKSSSIIRKSKNLKRKLTNLIINKMVRSRILIGLWDIDYESNLDEIVAKALVQDQYIIQEDITFDICVCFPSIKPVNDELIFHYKNRNQKEGDRVDYSKRGFIHAVEKGETVIEYIKPKKGKPGRNCQGLFIEVDEPLERFKPEFRVSGAIEILEDEKSIKYIAKKGGYVVFKDNTFDIQDSMQISQVSFKKTGSIDAGVKTDVKLHISESDYMEDAVGTGVEVEATEVKVAGNIGASAIVIAEEVEVGGQTHQSSKIEAKNAKINVHRGEIKTKQKCYITRLEGGKVEAKSVKVSQAIGGEIRAIDINIEVMGSNVKAYGVSKIIINNMLGENNKIIIDASKIEAYNVDIKELENKLVSTERELSVLNEEYEQKRVLAKKGEAAISSLKSKILEAKKRGQRVQPAFIVKIRQFQKLLDDIAELSDSISKIKNSLNETKRKLLAYQNMVINSKIINYGEWKKYTDIEFHLLYPQKSLHYTPSAGAKSQQIYLKKIDTKELDEVDYKICVKEVEKE